MRQDLQTDLDSSATKITKNRIFNLEMDPFDADNDIDDLTVAPRRGSVLLRRGGGTTAVERTPDPAPVMEGFRLIVTPQVGVTTALHHTTIDCATADVKWYIDGAQVAAGASYVPAPVDAEKVLSVAIQPQDHPTLKYTFPGTVLAAETPSITGFRVPGEVTVPGAITLGWKFRVVKSRVNVELWRKPPGAQEFSADFATVPVHGATQWSHPLLPDDLGASFILRLTPLDARGRPYGSTASILIPKVTLAPSLAASIDSWYAAGTQELAIAPIPGRYRPPPKAALGSQPVLVLTPKNLSVMHTGTRMARCTWHELRIEYRREEPKAWTCWLGSFSLPIAGQSVTEVTQIILVLREYKRRAGKESGVLTLCGKGAAKQEADSFDEMVY